MRWAVLPLMAHDMIYTDCRYILPPMLTHVDDEYIDWETTSGRPRECLGCVSAKKKFRQKLLSVLEEGNVKFQQFQLFWENWTLKPKWKVFPHKIGCYCCCISLFQQKQPLLAEIIHLDTFGASAEMGKNIFRSPTIETDIDRGGEEQGPASVRRSLMSMQSGTHT